MILNIILPAEDDPNERMRALRLGKGQLPVQNPSYEVHLMPAYACAHTAGRLPHNSDLYRASGTLQALITRMVSYQ